MGIFDNFNQRMGNLGLSGNLGLLTTGAGLLEGQSPLQAVQAGLNVYGSMTEDEERRRRRAALAKLGEQYAGDPRLKAIIDADPEAGLSLIAQLEANKRAYRAPTTLQQRKNLAAELGYSPDSQEYRNILETGSSVTPNYATVEAADGRLYYLQGPNKGELVFPNAVPTPTNAVSTLGRLAQDLQAGRIDQQTYDAAVLKATQITPTLLEQRKELAKELGFGVGDTGYNAVLSTGKYEGVSAQTELAKLKQDLDNGLIDKATYDSRVAKIATQTPPASNVKNYQAGVDFVFEGRLIKKGEIFAIDQNDRDALGIALEVGEAILAPTRTESTVTNTPLVDSTANEILSNVTEEAAQAAEVSPTIDIAQAGGGDFGGVATDALNAAAGFFGTTFDASREQQKAAVNAANNSIKAPLVKALNKAGSNFTQKTVMQLLPNPSDSNEKFVQKAEALIPSLEDAMKVQARTIATSDDAVEVQVAENALREFARYTEGMKAAIKKYREDRQSGGLSATRQRADQILSGG